MRRSPYRVVRTDNVEAVRDLDDRIFRGSDPVQIARAIWWLVLDMDDQPVAFGGLSRCGDVAYLRRAGVLENARGVGLQRRLIRARVAHARRSGAGRVVTYTMPHNVASMRNLISEGFSPVSGHYYVGSGVVYWGKSLGK
jgi:GNAT superfamily N-acetyltransferase